MLGSPAGPGGPTQRGLWPLAPAPAPSATSFTADGFSKCGVYSLFPGGPTFGSALYSHARTIGQFTSGHIQQSSSPFYHKDSLFSSTGYTFGAPTPPPGSPYSPVPVTQLELLTKGFNSNIIIQQQQQQAATEYHHHHHHQLSPSKIKSNNNNNNTITTIIENNNKKCDEKCCNSNNSNNLKQKTSPSLICNNNNNNNNNSNCQSPTYSNKKLINSENNNNVISSGCSRTNPVEWNGVNIKKEPGLANTSVPCQVAEISTSVSPIIKLEVTSPKNSSDGFISSNSSGFNSTVGNIPVGIAVARQRFHQQEVIGSPSLPPAGLLTTVNAAAQIKEVGRISEMGEAAGTTAAGMAAAATGGAVGGATLLHCTDDRSTALAGWPIGGTHNPAMATPTLWQYPASVPMEPMVPLPVPMPPVGIQLVRDPTTGGLLLLPTTGLEPLQQAVVWPSYHQPSSVLLPPLPPPPLQLLSSATTSDYLSSSTTLHQHTQTHSTRLLTVTTDTSNTKRNNKIPLPIPTTTLIKIETDATTSSLDQTKTLQAVSTIASSNTGTAVFTDQNMHPLVTTHVIYQHPTTNLILPPHQHQQETICREQATSPVTCLTPPPEASSVHEEDDVEQQSTLSVQDASNQTDSPICSEEEETNKETLDEISSASINSNTSFTPVPEKIQEPEQVPEVSTQMEDEEISENHTKEQVQLDTPKPDISGLELLSNSIEEFESRKIKIEEVVAEPNKQENKDDVLTGIAHMSLKDKELGISNIPASASSGPPASVDDSLGGLDLLCALAEQRILEENDEKHKKSKEHKKEKRKSSKKHSLDEPKKKKSKLFNDIMCEKTSPPSKTVCFCPVSETYRRQYKTPESEEEVKKFIASKSQSMLISCCKGDWPCMNEMELDMRMKLADLQRQYREKQKELSKLKPKRHSSLHHHHHHHHDCSKKRSRKKSTQSERGLTPPPPHLDKIEQITPASPPPVKTHQDLVLLKPPTLCAFEPTTPSKPVAPATAATPSPAPPPTQPKLEAIKQSDRIINDYKNDLLRQQQQAAALADEQNDTLMVPSSPEKNSSSKKRKVGRPKKLHSPSDGYHVTTETIVAKKPKNNFVGYLLAAKEKLQMQQSRLFSNSPPRYVEEPSRTKKTKNNNNIIAEESVKSCKIRPKLKAEPTIKLYQDDEENHSEEEEEWEEESDYEMGEEPLDENGEVEQQQEQEQVREKQLPEEEIRVDEKEDDEEEEEEEEQEKPPTASIESRCTLTSKHLETDKLRVLTAMGGLFYAGHLNAVEPPDVYSITLDGERGNRPHIMSREEILRDAIVEVAPKSTQDLVAGTRLCAYWSQQYRCLYPGSVAEPGTPDPALDSKFVAVEFDDGDSGRIALEDIRLLPPDYPIIEYDPNPLLSLSKRRRRASTSVSTEERRRSICKDENSAKKQQILPDLELEKENKDINKQPEANENSSGGGSVANSHKERKRLKKKKRDKLKQKLEDKKRKRKHKCIDENCKHKKHHKKHHRKHKTKHHHNSTSSSSEGKKDLEKITEKEALQLPQVQENNNENEEKYDDFSEETVIVNPEDEVTMDDIQESIKSKKIRDRQESCESRSKMSAFLPARQLWGWSGKGYKRPRARGRSRKQFYKSIQRGKETITVGDSAVFLSTGRPDRPYIGKIEAMWELCAKMVVKVKWFYHPEETIGCPLNLQYPGALFESPHVDENDVQTISHKCEVLPLKDYTERLGDDPQRYETIYDNNDIYYLAGYYDPTTTTLKMEPEIPFTKADD